MQPVDRVILVPDAVGAQRVALEVARDRGDREHEPQVGRERRVLCEQSEAELVHVVARAVELAVVADHRLREREVAREQRGRRALDLAVDGGAELAHLRLEPLERALRLAAGHGGGVSRSGR